MYDILGVINDVCKTLKTLWKDEFYESFKEIAPTKAHTLEWLIFIFLVVVFVSILIISSLAIILFSSVCMIGIFILEIMNWCIVPLRKSKGK